MEPDELDALIDSWHPVAAESELPLRHVYHGQLLGQEFAIWRADDDNINVWENRCLHRGVRLSIAINDGRELKCQYHGWRYANRTASCTYIPAHPADAPARTITNNTFPVHRWAGLVWTTLGAPLGEPPSVGAGLLTRPVPIAARPSDVLEQIMQNPPGDGTRIEQISPLGITIAGTGTFLVQPLDSERCILRGILNESASTAAQRLAILRRYDIDLTEARRAAVSRSGSRPRPQPLNPAYPPVSAELGSLPAEGDSRDLPTRVRVTRAWDTAAGIRALELSPLSPETLPSGQAGAHLDVALPGGHIRQYSLVNGPGETGRYVLGVRRTPDSAGGSMAVHDQVREGDVLAVSFPRNCFPLRQDHEHTTLIAGGVGITPLLAMAQALTHRGLRHELHYYVGRDDEVAFAERLDQLPNVRIVVGLSPEQTQRDLEKVLTSNHDEHHQVYLCGPPPMIDAARKIADEAGWAEAAVHVEYFKNDRDIDQSSRFEVVLSRSVLTLPVEAGQSILDAVRAAGVSVPSSCEQGACGSCQVTVIDGIPHHQDVFLSAEEREAGRSVITCVSRSHSPQLTLDL